MAMRNSLSIFENSLNSYIYCLRWWEMAVASGLTIGLRLSGISYRLQNNQAPDTKELWRMVEEKASASTQGLMALTQAAIKPWPQMKGLDLVQYQLQLQKTALDAAFSFWKPFYHASTANALRLSRAGQSKSRQNR